jgi:hypothetical protein
MARAMRRTMDGDLRRLGGILGATPSEPGS